MRITSLDTIPFSYPAPAIGNNVLVKIHTDEEITGIAQLGDYPGVAEIARRVEPLILGEDPFNVERIWRKIYLGFSLRGRRGSTVNVLSGIEVALWDIIGKALKASVHRLLGGCYRDKVRVYASTLPVKHPEKYADLCRRYFERGFDTIKVRARIGFEQTLEVFKIVRETLGNEVELAADFNSSYGFSTAVKLIKKLERYELLFVEEPVPDDFVGKLARIRRAVDTPIAVGENLNTIFDFKERIVNEAVDIVQPDINVCGGLLEAKKICAFADAFGIPAVPHNFSTGLNTAATLQLSACTPNVALLEFPAAQEVLHKPPFLKEPLEVVDGFMKIPENPGVGIDINEEYLSQHPPKELEDSSKVFPTLRAQAYGDEEERWL